jgi:polyhydroxybutyrate depolymerase
MAIVISRFSTGSMGNKREAMMNNHYRKPAFTLARIVTFCFLYLLCSALLQPARAQTDEGTGSRWQRLQQIWETQRENRETVVGEESLGAMTANIRDDAFGGREMLVYVPRSLPAAGRRSLLVALHGGGGNARFMLDHLKIDGVAEKNGFIVAYLNGSAATRIGGNKLKAWNAGGGCCGEPYNGKVDDVGYITGAVRYLQQKYGVSPQRTFGVGHSNGAIMMQTMSCITDLFREVATLAGTLMAEVSSCPAALNHTIYNYHGALDVNLPIVGGFGSKGVTNINFTSQAKAKALFESAGGRYLLHVLPGADHSIEHLSLSSQTQDGLTIGERLARDLGLVAVK